MNKEKFETLAKELQFLHFDNSGEASNKRAHTSHPIFYVQDKVWVCSVEDAELNFSGEENEVKTEYYDPNSDEKYESLDDLKFSYDSMKEFKESIADVTEFESLYIYEDVCAHLTREAAQLYIDQNRHNLKEPRIYVKSMYRCHEMIGLVNAIANGFLVWKDSE